MSLFKKRAKDGLPDPNGPLSSRVAMLGRECWPAVSADGKKKRGPYDW